MIDQEFKNYVKHVKKTAQAKVGLAGIYRFTLENPDGSREVTYYHNIVPTVGLKLITNNLTDPTPDNDILISHAALGSSTGTPVLADTILTTETYRNAIASRTNINAIAYATAFFNQTETSGTYREAGIFCDGTGSANTGILLSRVSINVTKTTAQKLTIDWALTFVNV